MNNANYYEKVSVLEALKKGGLDIKLSALLMGFANLANKQIIKGLLFLLAEILFLITFVLQVIPSLHGLITLGTQKAGEVVDPETGRVMGLGDFYTGSFGSQTEPEIGLANRLRRTGILVDW